MWQIWSAVFLRLRAAGWQGVYRAYRRRYAIDPSFRFNGTGIHLYGEGRIELGENSYIGELSTLQAVAGQTLRIGRCCMVSHNVRMYTSTNDADFDPRRGPPPRIDGAIDVGDGVWIGANVFVSPGVRIGDNAVVGANSVVTSDIPPGEIWGGVPARAIRAKRIAA